MLVLHSYHQGFAWTDNISSGIQAAFAEYADTVEVIFEFMDTRRLYTDEYFGQLSELYRLKYAGKPVDVVIAADDQAFHFMMGPGQETFPGVPIVFCSVSGYEPAMRQDYPQLTGLLESIDIATTLDVALQLHPDTQEVAVITDMTRTGQALKAKAEAVFQSYEERVRFRYLEHQTVDELLPQVSALAGDTIVFLFIFSRDQTGRVFSHERRLSSLVEHCNVPIYSVWEFYAGYGIVGGMLASGKEEGRMAGSMALRILQGEAAADIPLETSPSRYVFDYAQLDRFGVKESSLPEGSIIINRPFSLYEEYRLVIWGVALIIAFLLVLVVLLMRTIATCRQVEAALRTSEERFRTLVESMDDVIFTLDREQRHTGVFGHWVERSGLTPEVFLGKTSREILGPETATVHEAANARALAGENVVYEWSVEGAEGREYYQTSLSPIRDTSGVVTGIVGVGRNITARKRVEDDLRESEKRYALARNAGQVGVWDWDLETDEIYLDPNLKGMLGYADHEIRNHLDDWGKLVHPDDAERVMAAADAHIEGSTPHYEATHRMVHRDGSVRWFLARGTAIRDESGRPYRVIGTDTDITARKQAEEGQRKALVDSLEAARALKRESDLVARIMDTSPVGIVTLNLQGEITFANNRAEEILGLTKDEITQRTYNAPEWHITDYDGGPFPDEALPFSQVMRTGQPVYDVRHAIEWPDGHRVLLSINAAPRLDEAGQVDGMVAAMEDVTVKVWTEKALWESEVKSRNIIESIPMGMHMYQLEPDGRLVFTGANPAADEILGVDNQQFVGKTIEEAFPALTETEVPQSYRRVASRGGIWQTDQIIYEEGGIAGAFEVRAFQTSPGRMVASFLDITERKRAEAEVLRLQHLLQNITDSMPSALVTLALDGRVLTWNPAAEALTSKDAARVKGQLLWQVCPELTRYRDLFEQVLHERQVAHCHREQLTTQAGITYRDVDVFPLVTNGIEGVVLRIDDVTRRVQIEEMMLQSAKMASVGGLAAGVAHEINNPLGAMMQSAQMLQIALDTNRSRTLERLRAYKIDPDGLGLYLQERGLAEYLQGIRDMGARAAKIVTDLLSFSRRQSSDAAPHDLNDLLERTLDLAVADYDLRKKYDFREIEIVREMALDLPQVLCDGQQVQQVVLNLVRNAAQAMAGKAEGESLYRPRLMLRTGYREGWVRLEVEDNGPGIPEAVRERLFEPFFTTKRVGEGTGLGLWLCWSIVVERHKGRMWVESDEDNGARFVVELPVAQFAGSVEEK